MVGLGLRDEARISTQFPPKLPKYPSFPLFINFASPDPLSPLFLLSFSADAPLFSWQGLRGKKGLFSRPRVSQTKGELNGEREKKISLN